MHKIKYISVLAYTISIIFTSSCAVDYSRPQGPFRTEYAADLPHSELVVENKSESTITLEMTGPEERKLIIPPNSTQSMTVIEGTYNYEASAPEATAASGSFSFKKQYRYTLKIEIRRTTK